MFGLHKAGLSLITYIGSYPRNMRSEDFKKRQKVAGFRMLNSLGQFNTLHDHRPKLFVGNKKKGLSKLIFYLRGMDTDRTFTHMNRQRVESPAACDISED